MEKYDTFLARITQEGANVAYVSGKSHLLVSEAYMVDLSSRHLSDTLLVGRLLVKINDILIN